MAKIFSVKHKHCIYCAADILEPCGPADQVEIGKLPDGKPYKATLTNPRNAKVHRLYFSAIAAAAKHWPEGVEPEPNGDADLLRAWLQCKANYSKKIYFPVSAKDAVIRLISEIRAADQFAFVKQVTVDGEPALAVFIPLSIAYETLTDEDFNPIKSSVFEHIESVMNCTITQLVEADENET